MIKVLWFASKGMNDDEANALAKALGEQLLITEYTKDVDSAYAVKHKIKDSDVIVVSKPPHIMRDVVKLADGKKVLRPNNEHTGRNKPPFREFKGYKKINNIVIEIDEEDF